MTTLNDVLSLVIIYLHFNIYIKKYFNIKKNWNFEGVMLESTNDKCIRYFFWLYPSMKHPFKQIISYCYDKCNYCYHPFGH